MFTYLGASRQKLDDRGRFHLPQRWQDQVERAGEMVLTAGPQGLLWLFERPAWEEQVSELKASLLQHADTRMLRSLLVGHAEAVNADNNNRILVSETLRNYAELKDTNAVYLVGAGHVVEIWTQAKWDAQVMEAKADPALFDQTKHSGAKAMEAPVTVLTTG